MVPTKKTATDIVGVPTSTEDVKFTENGYGNNFPRDNPQDNPDPALDTGKKRSTSYDSIDPVKGMEDLDLSRVLNRHRGCLHHLLRKFNTM